MMFFSETGRNASHIYIHEKQDEDDPGKDQLCSHQRKKIIQHISDQQLLKKVLNLFMIMVDPGPTSSFSQPGNNPIARIPAISTRAASFSFHAASVIYL